MPARDVVLTLTGRTELRSVVSVLGVVFRATPSRTGLWLAQLGLQAAFQAGLDQLLDQPVVTVKTDIAGIDNRVQIRAARYLSLLKRE